MASPPPQVQERIARENAEVRAVLGTVSPDNHLTLPLLRPVPGDVSSAYGLKRFFNDLERNPHRGLDLRAALGEPVRSAAAGQIVLAADQYYGGNSVFIDHGLGVFTVYMHLDEIKVRQGDMIEASKSPARGSDRPGHGAASASWPLCARPGGGPVGPFFANQSQQ